MADSDITKMKVADLKKELKLRNLPTTGNKNELTERLQAALLDGDTTLDDAVLNSDDILDDDVLNDDELDDDDDDDDVDDKSLLNDKSLEDVVLQTPPETKTIVSAATTDAIPAQKKVVLKRKLIAPEPDATNIASSTPTVGSPKIDAAAAADVASAVSLNTSATSLKDGDQTSGATPTKVPKIPITAPSDDDGIVIKNRAAETAAKDSNGKADATATGKDIVKLAEVTVLSYEERMALRAKRFGIPAAGAATPADKKPATVPTAAAAAVAAKPSAAVASLADSEQLKKRAERFGLTVADESAKLAARAERFGTAAAANNKTATTTTVPAASGGAAKKAASSLNDPELVEQMRKRAERFGGSVSKVMLQIENEEKLRERQERFNASAAASAAKVAATAPDTVTTTAPAVEVAATVADKTE